VDAKKEILVGVIDYNEKKSVAGYPAYYNVEQPLSIRN
jgi:hypothetical protein